MTKAKKITISILSLFLSAIFIFAIIFCILCFPIADAIDDEFISQDVSLSEIKANYQEVFVDDFNNGTLDVNSWNFEGSGVNRNNELQSYADNMEDGNIFFEDDCLNIVAKEESRNGKNYTSASITTQGKVAYRYGIFEMRAKLPFGNGLWPAFWLMGQTNFFNAQLWPVTGEIDIMESICGRENDNTVHSTIHYGGTIFSGSLYRDGGSYVLEEDKFSNDFHIFGVIITDRQMLFYVDDVVHTYLDITSPECDTFRKYDKYIIINLAIGGQWAGSPDSSTIFPNNYSIDYVKIYQRV